MCGIIGYLGTSNAIKIIIEGLQRLEYRGYDSAGVVVFGDGKFHCEKSPGKIKDLLKLLEGRKLPGNLGLGHTRWATHGPPTRANAHPHFSCNGKIALVHNGIIENFAELKKKLILKGHKFTSQTDTEVIVHLIEQFYSGDPFRALRRILLQLEGSFALGIIFKDHPGLLVAVRKDSPLLIGLKNGERFIASDLPAILPYTREVFYLDEKEFALLKPNSIEIFSFLGKRLTKSPSKIFWEEESSQKEGYPHFMLKEIFEEPSIAQRELSGRIFPEKGICDLGEIGIRAYFLRNLKRIIISACGTAYHAALFGKYAIQELARVPVDAGLSSEIRYSNIPFDKNTLFIAISQSGETADTLAAQRLAQKSGALTLAISNIKGSTLAREAKYTLYMRSGLEIGVAATKTYISQLVCMMLFSIYLAQLKGLISKKYAKLLLRDVVELPSKLRVLLKDAQQVKDCAEKYAKNYDFMYVGRKYNLPTAYEGALKLKEISYLHAEGYGGGEMKHGPLALVDDELLTVAVAVKGSVYQKMLSNIQEIRARSGKIVAVGSAGDKNLKTLCQEVFYVPESLELTSPVLAIVPLQLFAYFIATTLGRDVDQPRNLAKSVTVE